jgi:hypothetical protein
MLGIQQDEVEGLPTKQFRDEWIGDRERKPEHRQPALPPLD